MCVTRKFNGAANRGATLSGGQRQMPALKAIHLRSKKLLPGEAVAELDAPALCTCADCLSGAVSW